MITGSRISGVAAVLPSGRLSTAEVEQRLDAERRPAGPSRWA